MQSCYVCGAGPKKLGDRHGFPEPRPNTLEFGCNSLQTGEPDGIFIKTIYDVLQLPVTRSWWGRIRGVAKMGWAWPRPGAIVGGVAAAALAPPVARA